MEKKDIFIIGAGPVGLYVAIKLSELNFRVKVFDKRSALVPQEQSTGLTISAKGEHALKCIGVWEKIYNCSRLLKAREVHLPDGEIQRYVYSKVNNLCSLNRFDIVSILFDKAQEVGVTFEFNCKVKITSFEKPALQVKQPNGIAFVCEPLFIFCADGANSGARNSMQKRPYFNLSIKYSSKGYISFSIPRPDCLNTTSVHVWVSKNFTILGLPVNSEARGDTLACSLIFERGDVDFNTLPNYIIQCFPVFTAHLPVLKKSIEKRGWEESGWPMIDIKCSPWGWGHTLLLGDAAHATQPILGQGLNLGFSIASKMVDFIKSHPGSWISEIPSLVPELQLEANAVSEMAEKNASEVYEKLNVNSLAMKFKSFDTRLAKLTPVYIQHYHILAFTLFPYRFSQLLWNLNEAIISEILKMEDEVGFEKDQSELVVKHYSSTYFEGVSVLDYIKRFVTKEPV